MLLEAAVVLASVGLPAHPDLVLELPATPYAGPHAQVAPVYLDPYERPGRLLYRFDAVLRNAGGTLDVWRDPAGGHPVQGIWAGGRPDVTPDPASPPPADASVTRDDRAHTGARFEYVVEPSHEHWHFFSAARYELLAGTQTRTSDKIGFCFFDGFDLPQAGERFFEWEDQGPDGETWCGFDDPGSGFVRMGLSPGAADRYASQREFQWIDVTGLAAGPVLLRGVPNPEGHFVEMDGEPDVTEQPRVLPGVVARGAAILTAPGEAGSAQLEAEPLALEVPIRRSAACSPTAASNACYLWASPEEPLTFAIATAPRHGAVRLERVDARRMRATYVAAAGFSGTDEFSYTATDARGLRSEPARVQVEIRGAQAVTAAPEPPPAGAPAAAPPRPGPIVTARAGRRRGHLLLHLRLRERARVGVAVGRRTLPRRFLRAGAHRLRLGPAQRRRALRIVVTATAGERTDRRILRLRPRSRVG